MMKKTIYMIAVVTMMASSIAMAAFPSYYPKEGFQRAGILDDVRLKQQIIVVNDIPYSLANSLIVHSPRSYSVPSSELRIGSKIGYKMAAGGRLITEIWLLPSDYKNPRRGQ